MLIMLINLSIILLIIYGNEAYIPRDRNENDEVFHNNEKQLEIISELWVKVKNH